MFVGVPTLAVFAFVPVVLAQGQLAGILQALNASGLDQFANATASLIGTTAGQTVIAQLSQGNCTIFAPTDNALHNANPAIVNNETLADVVSYHIVPGNFINQTQTFPNVTIGHTLLNDSSVVTLEGNQSQVIIWSKHENGTLFITDAGFNTTVLNTTTSNGTAILTIDRVLNPPPNISTVLNASSDLSATTEFLNSTTLLSGPSLLDVLSSAHGVTVFAPNNAGVQAAQSSLAGISKNATALLNVFLNHVINGSSLYSTELLNGSTPTSAGGDDYTILANSTGTFISVGGSNPVQIVQTNAITSNGVMHIVNGVMLDTNSNPAAASSAFASATSVAAHTTETGAVTGTPTPSQTGAAKSGVNNWKLGLLPGMVAGVAQFV